MPRQPNNVRWRQSWAPPKLPVTQFAYVAHDPRWPEHRRKLAAAQEAKRNEVAVIVALGWMERTFDYIAGEIGVCREVISRELRVLGSTPATLGSTGGRTGAQFLAVLRRLTAHLAAGLMSLGSAALSGGHLGRRGGVQLAS
jgi:hypothetical protein